MPELDKHIPPESTNWLTVYPADNEVDARRLRDLAASFGAYPDTKETVLGLTEALETKSINGISLSEDDLQLLVKVLDFITQGIQLGLDEAISMRLRKIADQMTHDRRKENAALGFSEDFIFTNGDYRGPLIGDELTEEAGRVKPVSRNLALDEKEYKFDKETSPALRSGDTVNFLKNRVEQLLKLKETTGKPVILLDIGGMYASSFLELAGLFETEIRQGNLLLIVTNIAMNETQIESDLNQFADERGQYDVTALNYPRLYQQNHELVTFLTTDVAGLLKTDVKTKAGKLVSLAGSVDIAHESWSISQHSYSLEQDINLVTRLVGPTGLFMMRTHDSLKAKQGGLQDYPQQSLLSNGLTVLRNMFVAKQYRTITHDDLADSQINFQMRNVDQDMVRHAKNILSGAGLRNIEEVTLPKSGRQAQLNYSFWVGPEAAPLQLFDLEEGEVVIEPNES